MLSNLLSIRMAGAVLICVLTLASAVKAQNQAQPAGPKIVTLGSYEEWQHQCLEQTSGNRDCFISQLGISKDSQVRGLMTLIKDGGGYAARFEVPIGVYLPLGLSLTIDGKDYGVAPFERCFPDRCIAFAEIKDETVAIMRRGSVATLIVHSAPGQRIFVPISLKGITAAIRALG